MHPSVRIDATVLTDEELKDISLFLSNISAIQDVSVATIGFTDAGRNEALRLHAATEPLFLCISFVSKHWSQITAGSTEAFAAAKAGVWLSEQLRGWRSQRKARYEMKPLFDAHGHIVTMVKIEKKS